MKLNLKHFIFLQVAIAKYDGTPVIDNKPVMFEVSMSNVGNAMVPQRSVSIQPVQGIATLPIYPEAETQSITVRVRGLCSELDFVSLLW